MSLSVNIMSYRYGHLAAQAIESVLNQSRRADVVRFYDDGAGDCEHLLEIYPEVEYIVRPKNLGVVMNFNMALDDTETDRVLFLGADNWLDPSALEILNQEKADIVSYHGMKWDTALEYWDVNQAHGSSLYTVKLAKQVGGYEASGNEHTEEDSVLFNKMLRAGASLKVVDLPLLHYRWRHRRNFNQ